jgi:hypothetical protein
MVRRVDDIAAILVILTLTIIGFYVAFGYISQTQSQKTKCECVCHINKRGE